jgi:hypothetical protein
MSTIVKPKPRIPTTTDCCKTLARFAIVKNSGEVKAKPTNTAANASAAPLLNHHCAPKSRSGSWSLL